MSVGVEGPIGDLAAFGISRGLRVLRNRANQYIATCKGCGAGLARREGREVWVLGIKRGSGYYRYFCAACFGVILAANLKFPTLDPDALAKLAEGPGAAASVGKPTGVELDRAISDRERERTGQRKRERKRTGAG